MTRALPLALSLAACGPDLPDGWEDATPVAELSQSECDGNPYEDFDEGYVVTEAAAGLAVEARELPFRCAQAVEGFWMEDGDGVRVLLQPVTMDPREVAGCDCLYDVDFTLPEATEGPVALFRRGDHASGLDAPVAVPAAEAD